MILHELLIRECYLNWFNVIRWLVVIPAAVVGFLISYFSLGFFAGLILDWCPWGVVNLRIGSCQPPQWFFSLFYFLGAAFCPILFVGFGTMAAPKQKRIVSWALFVLGAAISTFLMWGFLIRLDMQGTIILFVAYASGLVAIRLWSMVLGYRENN